MATPLPHETFGNQSSDILLVFLHGWPDTSAIWDLITPSFEESCFILNVTYPNYSTKEKKPWGISFEETIARLKVTIEQTNQAKRQIVLVGHDWGAFYSYYLDYLHPKFVTEIIALDVAADVPIYNPFFIGFLFIYQLWLITAFLFGGKIGKFITQAIITCFMYKPQWKPRIDGSWNYPYFQLWRKLLTNRFRVIPDYKPSANVVFVAGKKNPLKIYTKKWRELMESDPRHEFHLGDFYHWIQIEQPGLLVDLIKKRTKLLSLSKKNIEMKRFSEN